MISVIVVTYNQEKTIARTLDSILAQKVNTPVEIIIGDDCSSDSTGAICRRYATENPESIVYLNRSQNMGVTANYFDCIAHARGEYLADCAGDDFWPDPDKLQAQLDVIENDPQVSLVATDWLQRDSVTGKLSRHPANPQPQSVTRFSRGELAVPILTNTHVVHLCSALYRKSLIDSAVEANPDMFVNKTYSCEDQQILLQMATKGDIVILPRVSLYYSVGHDSISHRPDFDSMFDYSMRATSQAIRLSGFFHLDRPEVTEFFRRRTDHLASLAFHSASTPRRDRFRRFIHRKRINPRPKTRLYLALMYWKPLWNMACRLAKKFKR